MRTCFGDDGGNGKKKKKAMIEFYFGCIEFDMPI